jgi:hypothetical protein
MNILAHICCAPCLTYPHKKITLDGHTLTGLFYNPNIHPYTEYQKRREALIQYTETKPIEIIYHDEYPLEEFLKQALNTANRCEYCYTQRLEHTAKTAADEGFDAFTTTLLLSPYQKHELIKQIGERTAKKHNIPFYYEDFREGYRESRRMTFELGLYRQKYCGCIFSEYERYRKQR